MGDSKGKGKIFKKESKTIIFTKKTRGILMLLKGGVGGMGLREVLGFTQKYVFGK